MGLLAMPQQSELLRPSCRSGCRSLHIRRSLPRRSSVPLHDRFQPKRLFTSTSITHVSRRGLIVGAEGIGAPILVAGLVFAGAVAASTSFLGGPSLVKSGMAKFKKNKVEEAVLDFDRVMEEEPRMIPFLWQRGLALYYLGRYEEAAKQFREDVAVNPNDTEEAIWAFISEAQLIGPDAARRQFLKVGTDPRSVMRTAYEVFKNGEHPNKLLRVGMEDTGGHDAFYSLLYTALWWESAGNEPQARAAMTAAVDTEYGRKSGDYMASLAQIHCLRRGWPM